MKKTVFGIFFLLFSLASYADPIPYPQTDSIKDNTSAIEKLRSDLSLAKDKKIQLTILQKISERFLLLEKYDSAMHHINSGIILMNNDEAANAIHAAYLYRFKGVVYYYLYDRANAIIWFEKSRATAKLYQLPYEEMVASSNLGGMYIEEKKYTIAEKMLTRCDSISQAKNYLEDAKYLVGKRLLATLYKQTNRLPQAKAIFEGLIAESRKLNKHEVLASALTYYANFLKDEKEFVQSEIYFLEALDIAKKMNFSSNIVAIYAEMASMYTNKGDYKKANICKDSAYQLKIKMFQDQMQSSISESEAKYNNIVLKSQLELAEKKRRIQWAVFAILALIGLVIGLLNYVRQKRKEILMQQKQNKATLNALIEGEEKERIRLARELHDGIVQEIAILGRNFSNVQLSNFDQNKIVLQEKIQQIGSEVRSISHSLMPQMLTSFGLIVALKDLFHRNFEHTSIEYEFETKGIEERLPARVEIALYRIAQELINNIIKHSKATKVEAQLVLNRNMLFFIIDDNGRGMQQENKTGIGLASIESRLQILNGKLEYESDESHGTSSIIRIPLDALQKEEI